VTLSGQVALVTGGDSGIGAECARALAAAGARVAINYRKGAEAADALCEQIHQDGGRAIAVQADVSVESEVEAMLERCVAELGRIDILVANAGMQMDAPVAAMTLEQWKRVLDVNLTGQFLCARGAIRRFLAQPESKVSRARGKIVCMSSVHQVIPWSGHVNYASSKGGIHMMMMSLAQEVAPKRIRVNAIAPGAIRTPINQPAWQTPEALASLLELVPYKRIGEPDDIARAVVWLASDASDYVNGATLFVDGGMTLYPKFASGG